MATRVERRSGFRDCRVLGGVRDLGDDRRQFRLQDLTIDASSARVFGGDLVEGDIVAVYADACAHNGLLVAREIRRLEGVRPSPSGRWRSVQGFVVTHAEEDIFQLHVLGEGPLDVKIHDRTRFEGGHASDIARNTRVRVIGKLGKSGTLHAAKVDLLPLHPERRTRRR